MTKTHPLYIGKLSFIWYNSIENDYQLNVSEKVVYSCKIQSFIIRYKLNISKKQAISSQNSN
ncbi:hypothetical protein STFR1_50010 [Bacillus vallismortis]